MNKSRQSKTDSLRKRSTAAEACHFDGDVRLEEVEQNLGQQTLAQLNVLKRRLIYLGGCLKRSWIGQKKTFAVQNCCSGIQSYYGDNRMTVLTGQIS